MSSEAILLFAVAIIGLFAINVAVLRAVTPRDASRDDPREYDAPKIASVRKGLRSITSTVADLGAQLSRTQSELDELMAASWTERQTLEQKMVELVQGLLPILDFSEPDASDSSDKQAEMLQSMQRRIRSTLSEIGVRQLTVTVGDAFAGARHVSLGTQTSQAPAGMIVSVVRGGYELVDANGDCQLLRPAGVIVSSGPEFPNGRELDRIETESMGDRDDGYERSPLGEAPQKETEG